MAARRGDWETLHVSAPKAPLKPHPETYDAREAHRPAVEVLGVRASVESVSEVRWCECVAQWEAPPWRERCEERAHVTWKRVPSGQQCRLSGPTRRV